MLVLPDLARRAPQKAPGLLFLDFPAGWRRSTFASLSFPRSHPGCAPFLPFATSPLPEDAAHFDRGCPVPLNLHRFLKGRASPVSPSADQPNRFFACLGTLPPSVCHRRSFALLLRGLSPPPPLQIAQRQSPEDGTARQLHDSRRDDSRAAANPRGRRLCGGLHGRHVPCRPGSAAELLVQRSLSVSFNPSQPSQDMPILLLRARTIEATQHDQRKDSHAFPTCQDRPG